MKILALDTATEACSVSLGLGDQQIDRYVELERGHAEQLLPMIEGVLAEGGVGLSSLDAIAFGRGPGGFTGVRLAVSAPTIALSLFARFASRKDNGFGLRVLAALRNEFGGHAVKNVRRA